MLASKAKIIDLAGYLPEKILSNEDLEILYPDWPKEKIYSKTGITKRHIASQDETASDLAFQAAKKLFERGCVKPSEIDFLILCTQTPDYILPTTACILQDRLGLPRNIGAIDMNLGCSGFVYALSIAKGLIETNAAKKILLITSDTYSKFIHPLDKSVRTIFGDGAVATLVENSDSNYDMIGPFIFGTDGSGADNLIIKSGLCRKEKNSDSSKEIEDLFGNIRSSENLYMNGPEIMNFSLTEVPLAFENILRKSKLNRDDINYFVFHQANKFMLESLRKKININEKKFPIFIDDKGNTVSSSIPFALIGLKEKNLLRPGITIMLVGFGVGYSWAATIVKF